VGRRGSRRVQRGLDGGQSGKRLLGEAWFTFLELQAFGLGITEEDFRGGGKARRTGNPWEVAPDHKKELADYLAPNGLDARGRIWAEEFPDRDGFRLTQHDDDLPS
jgi:hypothetical protein